MAAPVALAVLFLGSPMAGQEEEIDLRPWRTEDVLDERIDEDAQYALMRMFAGEFFDAIIASDILSAIKGGRLAGVYQADRQVPAMRARNMGGNWWEIVPEGFDAICWKEPSEALPMIVYRKSIGQVRGAQSERPAGQGVARTPDRLSRAARGGSFQPRCRRPRAQTEGDEEEALQAGPDGVAPVRVGPPPEPGGEEPGGRTKEMDKPVAPQRTGSARPAIRERLDPALQAAWISCGLPPAPPRAYIETIRKPPPPPPPDDDVPPDLPPGLMVIVEGNGRPLAGAEVGITNLTSGDAASGVTGGDGTVQFEVSPGTVGVVVGGPLDGPFCVPQYLVVEVYPGTFHGLSARLDCPEIPPRQPEPECDEDRWHDVWNACGRGILRSAGKCIADAYISYAKCGRDPICAGKAFAKFLVCREFLDYRRKIQECVDKANAESHCSFPGPA